MSVTLIINTNCMAENAKLKSSGGVAYNLREYLLKTFILPAAIKSKHIDEILVAGVFEEGKGYSYVPVEQVHGNCADALLQRQAAFNASAFWEGHDDWVIFQHDDHMLDFKSMVGMPTTAPVVSPQRWTRMRDPNGERLNGGEPGNLHAGAGHINGHCSIMRRYVGREIPWGDIEPCFTWDLEYSKRLRELGYNINFNSNVKCFDVEYGSEPWK